MARRKREAKTDSQDDQVVDLLLRVANGPDRDPKLLADFSGEPIAGASVHEVPPRVTRDEALRLQEEFQPLVQMAIDNPQQLQVQEYSRRLRELVAGHGEGLSIRPIGAYLTRSGRSTISFARLYKDVHAKLSHGVLLLLDGLKAYAPCRCKLPRCSRYYLAKKQPGGGPANRIYCSSDHRDEYRDSAERKAATKQSRKHK